MPNVDSIASRPKEYLSGTGLPLLAAGLVFIILGGGALIQQLLPRASAVQLVVQWIGVLSAGAVLWGARALRRRIVFPRGGYVVPRIEVRSRAILFGCLVGAVALGLFALALPGRLHPIESRFIPAGFAIWAAISLLVGGWRQGSSPMMWCSAYFVGLTALLWWMPGNTYARLSVLQLASGILATLAGAVTLRRFLKANPMLAEPKDE